MIPLVNPSHNGFSLRAGVLVFCAVLLLSIPQALLLPLLDRDEPRFAEASREMLQSGNIIVPTFNGAPRYAKPPLTYWAQAISFALLGQNALSARLPSIVATAGTAVLLFAWGAELGSAAAGLAAGLAYAFCLQAIQQGRVATADALLIFFMTLTVYAGWKVMTTEHPANARRSYFWDLILVLAFAGGFLAKGPEAFLPILPMLLYARGKRKRLLAEVFIAFDIGVVLVLLWAIPAYLMTNGDYWRAGLSEGIGQRAVSGLQGHGATSFLGYFAWLPYYVVLFWISALPWSPLLIAYRRKIFTGWNPEPVNCYLLQNIFLIFVVFTLMATKLPHYTLPAFPFIALIFARRWAAIGFSAARLTAFFWGTGIAYALIALIVIPIYFTGSMSPSPTRTLVHEAMPRLTPDTKFALVDFREPNAIWEMRRVSRENAQLLSESEVSPFLHQPGPHAVILSTPLWLKLQVGSASQWQVFETRGWNTAKAWDPKTRTFTTIDLTLVFKP